MPVISPRRVLIAPVGKVVVNVAHIAAPSPSPFPYSPLSLSPLVSVVSSSPAVDPSPVAPPPVWADTRVLLAHIAESRKEHAFVQGSHAIDVSSVVRTPTPPSSSGATKRFKPRSVANRRTRRHARRPQPSDQGSSLLICSFSSPSSVILSPQSLSQRRALALALRRRSSVVRRGGVRVQQQWSLVSSQSSHARFSRTASIRRRSEHQIIGLSLPAARVHERAGRCGTTRPTVARPGTCPTAQRGTRTQMDTPRTKHNARAHVRSGMPEIPRALDVELDMVTHSSIFRRHFLHLLVSVSSRPATVRFATSTTSLYRCFAVRASSACL